MRRIGQWDYYSAFAPAKIISCSWPCHRKEQNLGNVRDSESATREYTSTSATDLTSMEVMYKATTGTVVPLYDDSMMPPPYAYTIGDWVASLATAGMLERGVI